MAFRNLDGTSEDLFQIGVSNGGGPVLNRVGVTDRLKLPDKLNWYPEGSLVEGIPATDATGNMFVRKANYSSVTKPTVTDDAAAGYIEGSRWLNTATGNEYFCVDSTNGAAVWVKATAGNEAQTVTVAKQFGDFSSVKTAIASITDASSTKPYVVRVHPGLYTEDPFTIPPYICVYGVAEGVYSVILQTTSNVAHFITGTSGASMVNISVAGPTGVGQAAIYYIGESTTPLILRDVSILAGYYGIYANPPSARGIVHAFGVCNRYYGSVVNTFFRATGYANITAMSCAFMSGPPGAVVTGYYASGVNAEMTLDSCSFRNSSSTDSVYADAGAYIRINNTIFSRGGVAIHIGNTAGGTKVVASGCVISDNYTADINVEASDAFLAYTGTAHKSKLSIHASSTYSLGFTDSTTSENGFSVIGEMFIGGLTEHLPLNSYTNASFNSGLTSGGVVTRNTGLTIDISAGVGYCKTASGNAVQVTWSAVTGLTLAANGESYVYVTAAGTVTSSTSEPDEEITIELAIAVTDTTDVVFLTAHFYNPYQICIQKNKYAEEVVGPIHVSGVAATINGVTTSRIDVDAGTFYLHDQRVTVTATAPITFASWYRGTPWKYLKSQTTVDFTNYDSGTGTLTAMTAGKFRMDILFITDNGDGPEYHIVYGQTQYDTQGEAEVGSLPSIPATLQTEALRLAGVVAQQGATAITSIVDLRPKLGQYALVTSGVTAHGALSGLSLDDHTQYLLTSGTRAMGGSLNMGTNAITNVGLVDGRDVSVDGTKLDTIETNADVTDTANVDAAGAIMHTDIAPTEGFVRKTGVETYTTVKTNLIATTNPLVTSDTAAGYSVGSTWVNTITNAIYFCSNATTGAAIWRLVGASDTSVANKTGVDISFFTSSTPYIDVSSTSPLVICRFVFPGTTVNLPTQFKIIGSRNGTNGNSIVNIFDITHSLSICTITYSVAATTIYTTSTLTNLPVGESVFEVRAYKNTAAASKTQVHYFSLR